MHTFVEQFRHCDMRIDSQAIFFSPPPPPHHCYLDTVTSIVAEVSEEQPC
ncbi:unnamed protein product [Caretta caretta]